MRSNDSLRAGRITSTDARLITRIERRPGALYQRRAASLVRLRGKPYHRAASTSTLKGEDVTDLIVGLDRRTYARWHENVSADDIGTAKRIARTRATASGFDL